MTWYVSPTGRFVKRKPAKVKAPVDPRREHESARNREKQRRHLERLRCLCDLRVCALCRFAFVSLGGSNICSQCLWERGSLPFQNMRRRPSVRRTLIILKRSHPSWVTTRTVHAAIPIPNPQCLWVDLAVRRTWKEMERSRRDGLWYVHKMPRLIGLRPYVKEQFKGFKTGRPTKEAAFRRAIDNAGRH
jgi:hypothetical protein